LQTKNALILTNLFNNYLNDVSNTNRKSTEIQSNFQSLVSFMITQSNSLVIDPQQQQQQQQQQQDKQASSSSSSSSSSLNNKNNNNNNNNKINLDSFVASIGYVLNENNDCFNIKVNPLKETFYITANFFMSNYEDLFYCSIFI
jgi:hypothetical protein